MAEIRAELVYFGLNVLSVPEPGKDGVDGKCVPQIMDAWPMTVAVVGLRRPEADVFADLREVVARRAVLRMLAILLDEEPRGLLGNLPISQSGIVDKLGNGVLFDRKLAVPAVFCVSEREHGPIQIDILPIQRQGFVHTHTRHRDQAE